MAYLQETEIRRRADGSIDTAFYVARAESRRRGKSILRLMAACTMIWRASKRRKTAGC
jgi:hypothetical protein